MKKIIYKIWYHFHSAIYHKRLADLLHINEKGYPKFSHGLSDSGLWPSHCKKCGKDLEEIYKEFYPNWENDTETKIKWFS